MAKILVKYLKGLETYVPGDVRAIDSELYEKLKEEGIVEKTEILEEVFDDNVEKDELKGRNILDKKYKEGFVDVVIPTKDEKNVKSIKVLRDCEKRGEISLNIMVRTFSEQVGGFARSCNEGAGINKNLGEFVLFLNDDVKIEKGFFKELIEPFKDKEVGMVGTKQSEVSFGINGSIMCIRRELFEMIGGFDEGYFFMWEDNDMCINIKKRGYKIAISEAVAEHRGGKSINDQSEFWRANFYNGKNYYEKKWNDHRRIIGSMIVGNENGRYMSRVILDLFKRDLIDEMVVVCDNSNKETIEELERLKKYLPITIYEHKFKLFGKAENLLRERAISYAISKNPFGIIPIDADEFFDEELTRGGILRMLEEGIAYDFVLAHYWGDEKSVRVDGAFGHQKNIRLFRYCPEYSQKFFDRNLHCGSGPIYTYQNRKETDLILKHFGYIKKKDVDDKKKRQLEHDPKMLLENPDLYNRMIKEGEIIKFNKLKFLKLWKS